MNQNVCADSRRRSRVGPDRYPGRADVQRGHLRVVPATGGGSDGQKARRGKEGASRADLSAGQSRIRRTTTPTEGNAIACAPSGGGFFAGRHGVIADAALPPRSRGRSAVATATVRYPIPRDLAARRRDILAGISAAGRTPASAVWPRTSLQPGPSRTTTRTGSGYE